MVHIFTEFAYALFRKKRFVARSREEQSTRHVFALWKPQRTRPAL